MPSPPDAGVAAERREPGAAGRLLVWNRRLHYYLGLYFLFFTWLFAFTGLLLNHPQWQFAQFWPNRVQTTTQESVGVLDGGSDLERARDLMRQVGVTGEIHWPAQPPAPGALAFQVSRPGLMVELEADLAQGLVTVRRNQLNGWGVMHVLHTFTGVPAADARNNRDWTLTTVWALMMDAVALGLIVMVFSSYIMWYQLRTTRRWGIVALVLGFVTCGVFIGAFGWF